MSEMTYVRDVKAYDRHWLVVEPQPGTSTANQLQLHTGDKLLFSGSATNGTITRRRGTTDTPWGSNCSFSGTDLRSGTLTGDHLNNPRNQISITFFGANNKMQHSGSVTFTSPVGDELASSGTWMADEGP